MTRKSIFFILLFIFFGIAFFIAYQNLKSLAKNARNTIGYITNVKTSSKSAGIFIDFYFYVNNTKITGSSSLPCTTTECFRFHYKLLMGKSLPVIYEESKPSNCEMLFQSQNYKRYNVEPTIDQRRIVFSIDSVIKAR